MVSKCFLLISEILHVADPYSRASALIYKIIISSICHFKLLLFNFFLIYPCTLVFFQVLFKSFFLNYFEWSSFKWFPIFTYWYWTSILRLCFGSFPSYLSSSCVLRQVLIHGALIYLLSLLLIPECHCPQKYYHIAFLNFILLVFIGVW